MAYMDLCCIFGCIRPNDFSYSTRQGGGAPCSCSAYCVVYVVWYGFVGVLDLGGYYWGWGFRVLSLDL